MMRSTSCARVTRFLEDTGCLDDSGGHPQTAEELLPLVYEELRRLAGARMRRLPPGQTLQATALVHEAYLRVAEADRDWESRAHFFVAVARSMRNIIVDGVRRKACVKHGGGRRRENLDAIAVRVASPGEDTLAIHEALEVLGQHDPEQADLAVLRYLVGLSNRETAVVLGISLTTVERRSRFLRAWLRRFIDGDRGGREAMTPASGRARE